MDFQLTESFVDFKALSTNKTSWCAPTDTIEICCSVVSLEFFVLWSDLYFRTLCS